MVQYKVMDLTKYTSFEKLESDLNESARDGWRINGGNHFFIVLEKTSKGPAKRKKHAVQK